MTLAALAASSALTSITSVPTAPAAAKPAPAAPANGAPAPAFNKLLDRTRTSDDGAAKDETALPKGAKSDDTDSDTDTETKSDNVVTLKTETTPTPSPDALTAAVGEGVTAVLALIQMANAAMTAPPTAPPVVTTSTAPIIAAPTITASIVDTTPVALTNVPAALQQALTQVSADAPTPADAGTASTSEIVETPADVELPEATTVVSMPTRSAKPLDTATILAALKTRAALIDADAAPETATTATSIQTVDAAPITLPTQTTPVGTPAPSEPTLPVTSPAPVIVAEAVPVSSPIQTGDVRIAPAHPATAAEVIPLDATTTPVPTAVPSVALQPTTATIVDEAPASVAPAIVELTPAPLVNQAPAPVVATIAEQTSIPAAPLLGATAAPVAVTPPAAKVAAPRVDTRGEPVTAEAPRAENSDDSTAPIADAAASIEPLPTVVAAAPERAPRAEAATQAIPAAPADNQPVQRHLDLARDTQWLDQLTRDINMAAATNGHLKFQLNPERLGALTVEIANSASGASIKFTVDSVDAQKIIADAQPRLVAEARQQGLTIAETKVDLSNQRSNGGNSTMNGQSQQQSGQQSSQDAKHSVRSTSTMREEPAESATRDDDDRYA